MLVNRKTYRVLPRGSPGGNEATGGVPLDVSDTVVVSGVHKLKVGGKVLVGLGLLALEVEVVEVKIGALSVGNGGNDHEATLRRPVDGVAVLLLESAEVLEVSNSVALGLLGAEESNRRLGGNGGSTDRLGGGDDNEPVALGLPGKVYYGILDGVDNLHGDTLLLDTENLESGGLGLLGLGVTVDLDAKVGTLGLPVKLGIGNAEQVQ